MVNVNKHEIFPTVIYQFNCGFDDLNQLDITQMNAFILSNEKEDIVNQSKDGLHLLSTFQNLKNIILEQNKKYLSDLQYEFDKIEITSMWSNHLKPGQSPPPHTHSNNLLSGVFYLHSESSASPIQFFDPRVQSNILSPRNKPNKYNSSMIQFNCLPCTGYIFPAWLQHWVPPTQTDRVSVSWNILPRGAYGSMNEYQYALI